MARLFEPNPKILKRIASAFYECGSVTKTSLHLASRLRWDSSIKYLDWLQTNNYIIYVPNGGMKTYVLTQAGIEMFQKLIVFFDGMK
jgi:predicted transcriptional regulator